MKAEDGGRAFPTLEMFEEYHGGVGGYVKHYAPIGGMSLRDYFAAQAMADVYSHFDWMGDSINKAAALSYAIADAMIKERAK